MNARDEPTVSEDRIGLVAGWGRYPLVVAQALQRQGKQVYCLGVKDHADPALQHVCHDYQPIGVARLGAAVRYFRRRRSHIARRWPERSTRCFCFRGSIG